MSGDRIPCCVPFCRRTRKPGCSEWICQTHWAPVPRSMRLVHFRLGREYRKSFGNNSPYIYPGGSAERVEAVRLTHRHNRVWDRIKRLAVEKATGIG